MSTPLYALVDQYKADAEKLNDLELDEQTVTDTLESMTGDIELKAQNVAAMYLHLDFMAHAYKERATELTEHGKALQRRAERLFSYLERCLAEAGIKVIETPDVRMSWHKSSAVVIDEPALVPASFMRTPEPPPPSPDKQAIAAALKAGLDVPGAHIENRQHLQIK